MTSKLLRALRVFIQSLLGTSPDASLPDPVPVTPTIAQRLGKPVPYPGFEIETNLSVDVIVRRLTSTLGPGRVQAQRGDPPAGPSADPREIRIRLTGKYRLPGLLQRQVLRGAVDSTGRRTRVALLLTPRSESAALGQLLSAMAFTAFVGFVFLTWITGPSDISLLAVAVVSLALGAATGALAQGALNVRGNLKERRRLTRTASRLALLLEGDIVHWP